VALIGGHTDGHQYVAQAAEAGAVAIVVEKGRKYQVSQTVEAPIIVANNTYEALALLASAFYGYPGKKLGLIGVTGTNGKTTVTHLIEKMLQDYGKTVGLIGTLGQKRGTNKDYSTTGHTTPMAVELQEILAEMARENTQYVVMEVSSHALSQDRVAGCDFEVAVFTNLTQDHLDFHKTMDDYCKAKTLLFSSLQPQENKKRAAVINLDDPSAEKFIQACATGVEVYTYAIDNPKAVVRLDNVDYSISGASFTAITPAGTAKVSLKIAGKFSVYNALAALASGLALGIPLNTCIQSLESVEGVRGRFEVVSQEPFVVVDYAQTPDGLENILSAARLVTPKGGRLIAVFGCGGDRDATKRPKMGGIAERLADLLVITSDNPRSEDPQQIITDIISGIKRFDSERMVVNADREQAIHQAIDMANPNDIIVVAGKGHEDYQILSDRVIHFDDKEVVQEYVASKKASPPNASPKHQPQSV
jgi:UDP-N-acetylmuramoyl-L-alanyl-D-glutamate--2,6-diaminopimelate ligase